jgi:DNA-binding MarR family transcriptional regulator
MTSRRQVSDDDYARLLTVRTGLRRFEHWSAEQAAAHGLTASQHQLLLAVRGHAQAGPTIGQAADYLLIRHHSAVELVDRSVRAGLVERVRDADDHRVVRLRLSSAGERVLADLSSAHLEELARLTPLLQAMLGALGGQPA